MFDSIIRLIIILFWVVCAAICYAGVKHGYWWEVIIFVVVLLIALWWMED